MRRWIQAVIVAASLVFAGAVVAQEGTLEIAVDQSPVGLDPHVVTAFSSIAVMEQIYDGLVELNADLEIEPALAESWEISDDGLTYTVQLRDDVVFHNGRAMTADDVVYSLERILAEETGSPLASGFLQVSEVRAEGEHSVVFELSEPFAPFLANLLTLYVVPREVVEAQGDLQQAAVGTGPFMLDEVVPDTLVRLVANPDYYREGQPMLAGLDYNIVPEASTRAAGLRTGSYHMLPSLDAATSETLRNVPGVVLQTSQDLAYSLMGMNVEVAPFDRAAVRRAVNQIVNRDEAVQAVFLGNAVPGGPLSPALTEWALPLTEFACYEASADEGLALLEEAGAAGFEFEILTFGTIREVSDLAQVLQAQLTAAGIDTAVNVAEFGTFVQDWRNSNFDAFVSRNGGNVDPDGYLYRTFHSEGATNVFNFSDPEVDRLLEEGRTTTDPEQRFEIYAELQRMLACEGPIVHVAYGTLFTALSDDVEGFQQMGTRDLRYLRETSLR